MTRLPIVRPTAVVSALKEIGYVVDHQTGAHVIIYKMGHLPITVPKHNRDMKKGTLLQILRNPGPSTSEFIALL